MISYFLVTMFFVGYGLSSFHNHSLKKSHYKNFINPKFSTAFQFKILSEPVEKKNSYKIVGEIVKTEKNNDYLNTSGKVILYLEKTYKLKLLEIGDYVNAKAKISEIQEARNPNEFDYKEYLLYQNIYFQAYIKSGFWSKSGEPNQSYFITKIFRFKRKLQKLIEKYIFGEDERAVASALLLGNRTMLTAEILKAFSSSGATHILAVSGLHVGIFYGLLSFSLLWLKKNKYSKFLHPFLTIGGIWFYVLLTGASPSVMRAATMFTFFAIGESLNRYFSVYNIIAFSAIILIVLNPFIVTEVGFQLSYIAVIGIIYLQPKIYKWFVFKNYIGDKLWAITAVSLAAQIATFPLILLYFHQFPNLFWVSNIVVIPAAGLILYGGILLILVSFNHFLATIVGKVLSGIIFGLNYCVQQIESIPYALTTGIYISHIQSLLLYVFIIWVSVAFVKRSKLLFKYSLLVLLLLSISFSYKYYQSQNQQVFTVYHTPKATAIEFIDNNVSYSIIDSALLQNESQMLFRIKHNWWEKGIEEFKKIELYDFKGNKVFNIMDKQVLLVENQYSIPKSKINFDVVIISKSPKVYLETFTATVKSEVYIFDSSNEKWKEKYWKNDCEKLGLNCYFVNENNAYEQRF